MPPLISETLFPQNYSVGTSQFCIGYVHTVSCHDLPPSFHNVFPTALENATGVNFGLILSFEPALARLTFSSIKGILVTGLVIAACIVVITICFIRQWWSTIPASERRFCQRWFGFLAGNQSIVLRTAIVFLSGTACCIPLIIPPLILLSVRSQLERLPLQPWFQVEFGQVLPLTIIAASCFMSAVTLASVSQIYLVK